jgi:hypothetical protein
VLQNNTETLSGLDHLVHDTLLQERKTSSSVSLASEQDENWATRLIVSVVKPVPQVEGTVRVRLVTSFVVEKVDRHRDVAFRVQQGQVEIIVALVEAATSLCVLNLQLCQLVTVLSSRRTSLRSCDHFTASKKIAISITKLLGSALVAPQNTTTVCTYLCGNLTSLHRS